MRLRPPFGKPQRYRSRGTPDHFASGKTSREEVRPSSTGTALDLVAIGRSRVLPGRELVIQRSYLVQPIDDLFLGHRGCVATSSFRFLPEERGIGRSCGVRKPVIHVILTFARHGTIRIPKSDRVNRTSLVEPIIEVLSGKAPDSAAGIERRGDNRRGRHVAFCGDGAKDRWKVQGRRNWARR